MKLIDLLVKMKDNQMVEIVDAQRLGYDAGPVSEILFALRENMLYNIDADSYVNSIVYTRTPYHTFVHENFNKPTIRIVVN